MKHLPVGRRTARRSLAVLLGVTFLAGGAGVWAFVSDLMTTVDVLHDPVAVHADQQAFETLVVNNEDDEAFDLAFELGDELFGTPFNALDGGGALVGAGQRYTRVPRADLKGTREWFTHVPARVTGPNAAGCFECHEQPFEDGSGTPAQNVHRDAFRTGETRQFVERNTPHVFAPGAIQRLAEEMTDELHARRETLRHAACGGSGTFTIQLFAKGIDFGRLAATRTSTNPCRVSFNADGVHGVDFLGSVDNPDAPPDLIVRPFQWKGSVPFLRDFNRGASHNELGMQAVEIVGDDVDGDGDSVANELTVGDMTALAVYLAAQPRPTTLLELDSLGLIVPALSAAQVAAINRGRQVFQEVGCASCHVASLAIETPIFSEPSQNPAYRDGDAFPAGQNPSARGVDPGFPVTFDLTKDQPDNHIPRPDGSVFNLGVLRRDEAGRAIVELYGDLKRHVMGPRLAEPVNEIAGDDVTPIPIDPRNRHTPDTFLTENLWGVGSTAPYMHDGRATTLTEAILEHATSASDDPSEAGPSRRSFLARSTSDKQALIAFLDNLVLFKIEKEEEASAAKGFAAATTRRQVVKVKPKGVNIQLP